jgi:hypothetical protein
VLKNKWCFFHDLLALLFTSGRLLYKENEIMKYKFIITDDTGNKLLVGAETELRDLVVNGMQIVRNSNLHVEDTRLQLGSTDINNVMHLFRGETND